jgi:hypothetical protein
MIATNHGSPVPATASEACAPPRERDGQALHDGAHL